MGLIYTDLQMANAAEPSLLPMTVRALVDTGASYLCIPEKVAQQLDLREVDRRQVQIADGSEVTASYVGPIELTFKNRRMMTCALVMGDEALLGAIPMQDLDIVVRPNAETVEVNPLSPNIARGVAK